MYVLILENFNTGGRNFQEGEMYLLHRSNYRGGIQWFYLTDEKNSFSIGVPEYKQGAHLACTVSAQTRRFMESLEAEKLNKKERARA